MTHRVMESNNLLKCSSCNIVICELLSFVQNKADVMDEEGLFRICKSAFSEDEIKQAKALLFGYVPQRSMKRRGDAKASRDLEDIIGAIKATDPEILPIFVARELQKLPPVSFDHVDVTRLLKDILVIQNELKLIQDTFVKESNYVTVSEFEKLKIEIEELMKTKTGNSYEPNVNYRRGAFCLQDSAELNSGPMGMIHNNISLSPQRSFSGVNEPGQSLTSPTLSRISVATNASLSLTQTADTTVVKPIEKRVETTGLASAPSPQKPWCASTSSETAQAPTQPLPSLSRAMAADDEAPRSHLQPSNHAVRNSTKELVLASDPENAKPWCAADNKSPLVKPDKLNNGEYGGDWTQVGKRKPKQNRFAGRRGKGKVDENCKFKAAETKIPLYIYNVSKDTLAEDIKEYILGKTNVLVQPEKVCMREEKEYDSYKILVPEQKMFMFEKDELWPNGILFRRYIIFKNAGSKAGPRGDMDDTYSYSYSNSKYSKNSQSVKNGTRRE